MNVVDFFELSVGKWFSHQSSHDQNLCPQDRGKSNLIIETIATDNPVVAQICLDHNIDPSQALYAVKMRWDGAITLPAQKLAGSAILVPIATDSAHEGLLLRTSADSASSIAGRFLLNTNDELVLTTEFDTGCLEERVWFESPNVRLRHGIIKTSDRLSRTMFCSEIRMGVGPATSSAKS
jgi:hypothetical protein